MSAANFVQEYRDPQDRIDGEAVRDCVRGILAEAERALQMPAAQMRIVDCGCGTGQYLFEIEKYVSRAVGVEPDLAALSRAKQFKEQNGQTADLIHGFIEDVQLNEKFDLAISLTTVEHMPQARKSMERIVDLLRPGGVVYLTAPNKLWPIECHYHLPFLSYLPLPLSNLYLRVTGRGTSYESCSYARTYWGMKRLFAGLNCEVRFIVPDEKSQYVGVGDKSLVRSFIRRNGLRLIRRFPWFWIISKGFFMLIQKNREDGLKV